MLLIVSLTVAPMLYIHSIQVKHLHGTYVCIWKTANKMDFIERFPNRQIRKLKYRIKKLVVKCWTELASFISFFSPFYKVAAEFWILSFLTYHGHTNKQWASLVDSYMTCWLELFYKISPILYCEHLQHFAKEMCSFYLMSLP